MVLSQLDSPRSGPERHQAPLAAILGAALLLVASGRPAAASPAITLYRGDPSVSTGLLLGGWGSGQAVDTSAEAYSGSNSIKVTTDGFYAGGRLIFPQPVNITPQFTDPYTFLDLTMKFLPAQIRTNQGSNSGPGGYPGARPGGYPAPGGYPGAPGGPGAAADTTDPNSALLITPDTQRLRVVMRFDGATAEVTDFPLLRFPTSEPGWVRVAIPFPMFKVAPRLASYPLREMDIFGDATDTFYIGQIGTVTDTDPITVEPLEDQTVAVNDQVEFTATAEGGLTPLKYSWDFDKSDGLQEDAVGPRVTHVYTRASPENRPYVVTLTVSDLSGAKRPVSVETTVEVID